MEDLLGCVGGDDGTQVPGLGFRDIELFNFTLLAQQGWRILHNPETLRARILRAVYFPEGHFLEAELGTHHSHIWRTII